MSDAMRFKIEDGLLAFAVVDTAAVGYLDSWQTPGGIAVNLVTLDAYEDAAANWGCQVTTASIDASPNSNDETVDPTWCAAGKTIPNPSETSFTINGTYYQDAHVAAGLFAFLYANDTKEAYFYMGLGGATAPPAAVGRVRLVASNFAGPGRTSLTSSLAIPLARRYDAWVGDATTSAIVKADGTTTPVVVLAGAGAPRTATPVDA